MPNIVKYNLSTSPNSIQSGNFNIGVNNTPTNLSQFYTGICPIIGGYTIYINKASNGPSIYAPKNDTQLIEITNNLGGNVTTAADALVWLTSQPNMTVLNSNYPSIVTSGVSLNLDASFVSSYPKTGTIWYDLSGNNYSGATTNVGISYDSEIIELNETIKILNKKIFDMENNSCENKGTFLNIKTELATTITINEIYVTYIQRYGVPDYGIFDEEKLEQIEEELEHRKHYRE